MNSTDFTHKVHIDGVEALRSTDKAVLCDIEGDLIWIPQSQIDADSEVWEQGDSGTLVISEWIAKEKGFA